MSGVLSSDSRMILAVSVVVIFLAPGKVSWLMSVCLRMGCWGFSAMARLTMNSSPRLVQNGDVPDGEKMMTFPVMSAGTEPWNTVTLVVSSVSESAIWSEPPARVKASMQRW